MIFPENHGGKKKASQIIGETIGDFPTSWDFSGDTQLCLGRGVQNRLPGARKYHRGCQPVRDVVAGDRCPYDFVEKLMS